MTALEQRRFLSVSAHIRVLGNETTIQAGQSINVSAMPTKSGVGTSFGSGDAISSQIVWKFGDPSAKYNRLPGFNAAHEYDTPGKYKVTLRVTNADGQSDTASRIITVTPAKRKNVYVNPWGNNKSNGSTPGKAVKTIARAMQLVGDNTNLEFRRSETFNIPSPISLPFSNVQVGSYGSGKAPKLQIKSNGNQYRPVFVLSGKSHQVAIRNLEINAKGGYFGDGIIAGGSDITINSVDFEHLDNAIMANDKPTGLLAQSNYASTLKEYFAYVEGSDQAYLGNTAGDSTAQHNIRIYGSQILAYGNDLTNLPVGSSLATLRVNDGTDIYWSSNVLHGGQMYVGPLGPASAGSEPDESVSNVVIENNRWEEVKGHWSGNDRVDIQPGTSNVMIRNNDIQATNSSAISVSTYVVQDFAGKDVTRTVKNLQILSNTAVNNGTSGAFLSVGGGQQNAITLKDSLYVAPKIKVGTNATAAVRVDGRSDLDNFTTLSSGGGISGNVWNMPAGAKTMGVNYVSATPAGVSAYRTPAEWAADFPKQVGKDLFENIQPSQLTPIGAPPMSSGAATFSVPAAGVFSDLLGIARPESDWTAGALQTRL